MRHHSTFRLGSSDRCLLLIFLFLSNPALCVEAQKHFTEVLPVFSHLLSFALFLQLAYNIWTSPSCSPLLRAAVPRHKELRRWAQALPSAITGLCLQNHVLEIEARPPHEAVPVSAGPTNLTGRSLLIPPDSSRTINTMYSFVSCSLWPDHRVTSV